MRKTSNGPHAAKTRRLFKFLRANPKLFYKSHSTGKWGTASSPTEGKRLVQKVRVKNLLKWVRGGHETISTKSAEGGKTLFKVGKKKNDEGGSQGESII